MSKLVLDKILDIAFFRSFSSEELADIASRMTLLEMKPGQFLFREGDQGNYMAVVVAGSVEVVKESASGGRKVISTLGKGHLVGEMALLDRMPRSASVRSVEHGTVAVLSQEGFKALLRDNPDASVKLLCGIGRLLSLYLRRTSGHLAERLTALSSDS